MKFNPRAMGVVVLVLVPYVRAENGVVTIQQAYEQALSRSPAVAMMQAHGQAASALKNQAQTRRLPTIGFNSAYTRGDDPVYVFGSLLRQGRFSQPHFDPAFLNNPSDLTNFSNSLEAGIPLFTGFEITGRSQMADAGRAMAQAGEELARNQIGLQVVESYLDAILSVQTKALLQGVVKTAEADIADADRLMKRGLVLGSDYYAARAILESLRAGLEQAAMGEEEAKARLQILLGLPMGTDLPLAGTLSESHVPGDLPPLGGWPTSRPDLKMAAAQVTIMESQMKIERRSILPDVTAFGSLETNTNDFESNPSHHMGGVRLSLPLGDPTYFARKGEAGYKYQAAQKALDQAREQAQMEIESWVRHFRGLQKSLPNMTAARQMAQKSLELFRPLYREGRQSVLEVLRAEEAFVKVRRMELEVIQNLHKVETRLVASLGPLSGSTIKKLDDRLTTRLP